MSWLRVEYIRKFTYAINYTHLILETDSPERLLHVFYACRHFQVQLMHEDGYIPYWAAKNGNLEIFKLCPYVNKLHVYYMYLAGVNGHAHILEWLHTKGVDLSMGTWHIYEILRGGHLPVVQWLYTHNYISQHSIDNIFAFGHVHILDWLWLQDPELIKHSPLECAALDRVFYYKCKAKITWHHICREFMQFVENAGYY